MTPPTVVVNYPEEEDFPPRKEPLVNAPNTKANIAHSPSSQQHPPPNIATQVPLVSEQFSTPDPQGKRRATPDESAQFTDTGSEASIPVRDCYIY